MKTRLLIISALITALMSCNEEDPAANKAASQTAIPENQTLNSTEPENPAGTEPFQHSVSYAQSDMTVINLSSFINSNAARFEVLSNPVDGTAELIENRYLKYTPKSNGEENILIDSYDSNGMRVGRDTLFLLPNTNSCGLALYDSYKIKAGQTLVIDVLSNDLICESIDNMIFSAQSLALAKGMQFTLIPKSIDGTTVRLQLSYTPAENFRGKVRAIYTAAINVKDEYREVENGFLSNPEYYKFFGSGLIEIEVGD